MAMLVNPQPLTYEFAVQCVSASSMRAVSFSCGVLAEVSSGTALRNWLGTQQGT